MVARARGCSQEWSWWRSRELRVLRGDLGLFLMLAVVHCPLALQLADSIGRRQALSLASGAAAASVLSPGAATAATAAASPLKLPSFGVGAWAWGDSLFWTYEKKEDAALRDVFDYVVESGVTLFDTAEVYGLGRSETLLGQFAASNPKAANIQIATKFAALPWRTKPSDVLEAAKKSTDRLGRPIDLYQIHFPNAYANEEYWDGLAMAVDSGLVKAAGVSNYGKDAVRACKARLASRGVPLVSNQIQLSLLYDYPLKNGLIDECKAQGVQVLAYSPLGLGLLTGKYTAESLPTGPRKSIAEKALADPAFGPLLDTMREVGRGSASPAQVALAWCAAKGTTVIPGARTLKQAESNLAARSLKLTAADVAALDAASAKLGPVLSPDSGPFPKKDKDTGLVMFDS